MNDPPQSASYRDPFELPPPRAHPRLSHGGRAHIHQKGCRKAARPGRSTVARTLLRSCSELAPSCSRSRDPAPMRRLLLGQLGGKSGATSDGSTTGLRRINKRMWHRFQCKSQRCGAESCIHQILGRPTLGCKVAEQRTTPESPITGKHPPTTISENELAGCMAKVSQN